MIIVRPRLSEIIKERNLTQMQLAEMSGVPQGSISRFDKNERHVDWHVFAIAKALGLSIEELFVISDASE